MVKSPLVVQDYLCPIESTRKKLMEENSSRSNHKKFCFKKYVTEKERIKKYLEERKSTYIWVALTMFLFIVLM